MSASEHVQVSGLIQHLLWSPITDKTPRQKSKRRALISAVQWGTIYPPYTNLACIGIVYSTIAPLLTLLVVIALSLFWVPFRYNLLYVVKPLKHSLDSGSVSLDIRFALSSCAEPAVHGYLCAGAISCRPFLTGT